MLKKIKQLKIKKKKGITTVNAAVGTLLMIILLAVLLDTMTLSNRYMSLHDTVKELARTMAVQGGCMREKPEGYPENYYNTVELGKLIAKTMRVGGFKDCDYKIYVNYTEFDETTGQDITYSRDFMIYKDGDLTVKPTNEIDYLNDFSVTIEAKYSWIFSRYAVGMPETTLKATAPGVSEWKYDYDHWDSES